MQGETLPAGKTPSTKKKVKGQHCLKRFHSPVPLFRDRKGEFNSGSRLSFGAIVPWLLIPWIRVKTQ